MTSRRLRKLFRGGLAGMVPALLLVLGACTDEVPTSQDGSLIPVDAQTVEIILSWDEFGRDFQTYEGFGSVAFLPTLIIAREHGGDVDAAALIRFSGLPGSVQVRPPGSETTQADTAYVPVGGTMVLRMDTTRFRPSGPVELTASRIESRWDERTANWQMAVDTFGDALAWGAPGAADAVPFSTVTWDPDAADSIIFDVDSVTANAWRSSDDEARGARIGVGTSGVILEASASIFRARVRSQVNPDTLIQVAATALHQTFLYTPDPGVSASEFRIGGAPARRASLRLEIPERIEGDHPSCLSIACPLEITPERVVYAGLVLRSLPTMPVGLQPVDTLPMDVRPALAPDRLPKSPLGPTVQPTLRRIAPEAFAGTGGVSVEVPLTRYFRDLIGPAPAETDDGVPRTPSTLTFLSPSEPLSLGFGTFAGPGSPGEPYLRVILTLSDGVSLP